MVRILGDLSHQKRNFWTEDKNNLHDISTNYNKSWENYYFIRYILGNGLSPNHSPDINPGLEVQNEKQQSNASLPSAVQTKLQRNSVSVISSQVCFK